MIKKNFWIVSTLLFLFALFFGCADDSDVSDTNAGLDPKVRETQYGWTAGVEAPENTWAWLSVPYAAPPTGDLRWKAPRPPKAWTDIRPADSYCAPCAQYAGFLTTMDFSSPVTGSEDCLYLNIRRPRTAESGLPVFFWIHGGGNDVGAASEEQYDGSRFADFGNMIFVSVNYRLGPFGWLAHPGLRSGANGDDASGNYGTLDLIMALEWVRDNISAFGGDPDNVTIAGQSAGASDVFSLMLSKRARGLFHRAIAQSGVLKTSRLSAGDKAGRRLVEKLLAGDGLTEPPEGDVADYLRSKSAEEILLQYEAGFAGMLDDIECPQIFEDGSIIPHEAEKLFAGGDYNRVPVMLGCTSDEMKAFLPFHDGIISEEQSVFSVAAKIFLADPNGAEPVVDIRELISISPELYDFIADYTNRRIKAEGRDKAAETIAMNSPEGVYVYEFAWDEAPAPLDILFGAAHGIEIDFIFGNFDKFSLFNSAWNERNKEKRLELSNTVMIYWSEFAGTGDPNYINYHPWNPWTAGDPKYLKLDSQITEGTEIKSVSQLKAEMENSDFFKNLNDHDKDLVRGLTGL